MLQRQPPIESVPKAIQMLRRPIRAQRSAVSTGAALIVPYGLPPPLFGPVPGRTRARRSADVFGSGDGYGTDSESAAEEDDVRGDITAGDPNEYLWGPEDNAPLPLDSQSSEFGDMESQGSGFDNATLNIAGAACAFGLEVDDDMPGLVEVSGSEDDDESDSGTRLDDTSSSLPPILPAIVEAAPQNSGRTKITSFFKVETAAEKAVRLERDHREFAEHAEEKRLRETNAIRQKAARIRADGRERVARFRARRREEKKASGWMPGQKRKRVDLVEEDVRKNKKPCGPKQKEKNKKKDAKLTNWFHPLIWSQVITAAARAGRSWHPSAIVREARKLNLGVFWKLTPQVVGRWIDPEANAAGVSKWKDSVLRNVAWAKGNSPGGHLTRTGILQPYPDIRKRINDHLTSLREAGVALTLLTIRGIMVAHIQHGAPHLFERPLGSDGSTFRCGETFVRRYLRNTLGWSERRATKAAHKLPANYEKILDAAFLREAYIIRDYAIPAALRVNTDQTQLLYQQGSGSTWTKRASGVLLPMQAVFGGKTASSCPSPSSNRYHEAVKLQYTMVPSLTATYWSNHGTMRSLVDDVIAPYFEAKKTELGLPSSQFSIWTIDCWSVHRSKKFLDWMKQNHPTIILLFVPGGCTGVWQPLDVGIQRLLKLSTKRPAHRDIVEEALGQIRAGKPGSEIKLNTTIGVLRDRSVGWIVQAIHDINNPETIQKAFELCRVGDFNRSQASLTSPEALGRLRHLRQDNPELYAELTQSGDAVTTIPVSEIEEAPFFEQDVYDDCDVPLKVVSDLLAAGSSSVTAGFAVSENGGLARSGDAEKSDAEEEPAPPPATLGRGQRRKIATSRYQGPLWEEH
ncbi:DDE superfamily endonuclease [Mycena venus]|uniref:DDE superfamily endonuclease n=1 Tax=Mycena venus TaxID=2733690 RepID=A0A8H7DEL5_9AGAR|nr:DDE superfamily endonuclease [Mycena venus]